MDIAVALILSLSKDEGVAPGAWDHGSIPRPSLGISKDLAFAKMLKLSPGNSFLPRKGGRGRCGTISPNLSPPAGEKARSWT